MPLTVNGRVHGGQQAVVGAQIQLYVAGNAGNGSASSALLNKTVTSGTDGSFSITGDYSCPSATAQVYLVATQGNPGLGSGGNNPALAMMAPLGSCGNLTPTQFIWINEVTTVAAAWTLAPFTKDISDIGASSTNTTGLANAFLNAQLIANTATGTVATLPSNLTTEPGKIYALADAVASCINSDGTTGCSPLFRRPLPSGGSAPTNTWDALMNIVKNPANNVAGVFSAIGPQPPFATTLTQAPNDWTLSLTVTGGGMMTAGPGDTPPDESPEALGIDSQGNVWVGDHSGILSAFSPQGTPLSSAGFGSANASEAYGLTIDPNDNVWMTLGEYGYHNGSKGSLEEFSGVSSGGALGTPTIFTDNSLDYPYAVASDSNGTIFVANYYCRRERYEPVVVQSRDQYLHRHTNEQQYWVLSRAGSGYGAWRMAYGRLGRSIASSITMPMAICSSRLTAAVPRMPLRSTPRAMCGWRMNKTRAQAVGTTER